MILLSLLGLVALLQADAQAGGTAPVAQPIPFDHKLHAARGLKCGFCHPMTGTGEAAGLPKASDCLGCHDGAGAPSQIAARIAAAGPGGDDIAWRRVYRLPSFAVFSHRRHSQAGAGCDRCHGPVAERVELAREGDISMKACLACHRASKAPTACNSCHELER
jgi:hypothetical protein